MEATKAVQIIKPTTSTPSRNILKKNSSSNQSGNSRKKQKIIEKPKQLVSNRRFEPKVKNKKKSGPQSITRVSHPNLLCRSILKRL